MADQNDFATAVGALIKGRVPVRVIPPAGVDLNTLTKTEDVLFTGAAGLLNAPDTSVGMVQIRNGNGNISQVWRPLSRSTPVNWSRVKAGTAAWSPWSLLSATGLPPAPTVSFNDMRVPGSYSIQFTSHPDQPAPNVGTLEVVPSTGHVAQRFTTWENPQRVFRRRAINGTDWSVWTQDPMRSEISALAGRVTSLEDRPGSTGTTDYAAPTRGALVPAPTTVTSKSGSQIMQVMSRDRLYGWSTGGSSVQETRDEGQTWVQINAAGGSNPFAGSTVESVRQLANGEILVTNYRGSTLRREVWVSRNYADPATRTFVKTMDGRARSIKYTSAWSQSDHGNLVLINEYGPKTGLLWDNQEVLPGENARYTFLSTDYGQTWATVFDLNTYLTTQQGRATTDRQHLHGVAWDPYWDRIWVTFGDNSAGTGSNGIVYSDDFGSTWQTAHFHGESANAPHQLVGIQPMPKCVLFYGDMGPDVIRIDRAEGKRRADFYSTPVAYNSTSAGMHLCQSFMRAERPGDDAPALAAFSAEGATAPSFAVATLDGWSFVEIWRDSASQSPGFGARSIVGPTIRGRVIIGSNDLKAAGEWSQIVAPAPGY